MDRAVWDDPHPPTHPPTHPPNRAVSDEREGPPPIRPPSLPYPAAAPAALTLSESRYPSPGIRVPVSESRYPRKRERGEDEAVAGREMERER